MCLFILFFFFHLAGIDGSLNFQFESVEFMHRIYFQIFTNKMFKKSKIHIT